MIQFPAAGGGGPHGATGLAKHTLLGDLGKPTVRIRGIRKCPKCEVYNGTGGLSCKNKTCDMVFKTGIDTVGNKKEISASEVRSQFGIMENVVVSCKSMNDNEDDNLVSYVGVKQEIFIKKDPLEFSIKEECLNNVALDSDIKEVSYCAGGANDIYIKEELLCDVYDPIDIKEELINDELGDDILDPKRRFLTGATGTGGLTVTKEELFVAADEVVFEESEKDTESKHTIGLEENYKVKLDHDYCIQKETTDILMKYKRNQLTGSWLKEHQETLTEKNVHRTAIIERPFECDWKYCGKNFTQKKHLTVHLKTHTGERSFECDWDNCVMKFKDKRNLTVHLKIHTGERPFECDWKNCGRKFIQKSQLTVHLRNHTGDRPFKCNWDNCGMKFINKRNLTVHMSIHTRDLPFKCDWENCGKMFAEKTQLTVHIRTHTGERPFACDWSNCDQRFLKKWDLTAHKKTHTGKGPFACNWSRCDETYKFKEVLNIHLRTHLRAYTGEGPFACNWSHCNKTYKFKEHLKIHLRNHAI